MSVPAAKTYLGSCHCGAIRFECRLDLREGLRKCNCSFCVKTRVLKAFAKPGDFRLLQGADALADYRFGDGWIHHRFCRHCGVRPFGEGRLGDGSADFYAVNIACLDNVETIELIEAPVCYENGRNDDWWSVPAETRHL